MSVFDVPPECIFTDNRSDLSKTFIKVRIEGECFSNEEFAQNRSGGGRPESVPGQANCDVFGLTWSASANDVIAVNSSQFKICTEFPRSNFHGEIVLSVSVQIRTNCSSANTKCNYCDDDKHYFVTRNASK